MEAEMQPVEMLVDLVISEEMDPWDIDIADIANRFIKEVKKMQKLNLRLSGKTLLAASILLRMKSDSLLPREAALFEEEPDWGYMLEDAPEDIFSISTPVRRRAERKTTLFELIDALQRALSEEMIRKNFPREGRPRPKMVIPIDEETIKERMEKIYVTIKKFTERDKVVKFSDLISEKKDIIEVLIALLHLDSQRQITIWQKELFGEIFITLN